MFSSAGSAEELVRDVSVTGSVFSPLPTSASLALTVTVSPTVASPSSSPTPSFSSPPSFPSLSAPVLVLSVSCFAEVLTAMLSVGGVEEEVSGVTVLASLLELSCNPVEHGVASGSLSVMLAANRAKTFSEREGREWESVTGVLTSAQVHRRK